MKYIDENVAGKDCMIVAIYNAAVSKGMSAGYSEIKYICKANRWYSEDDGFYGSKYVEALKYFGFNPSEPKQVTDLARVSAKVKAGSQYILILKPKDFYIGHSTFIMKGRKGVKTLNTYCSGTGWRTLYEQIESNDLTAYEIELK